MKTKYVVRIAERIFIIVALRKRTKISGNLWRVVRVNDEVVILDREELIDTGKNLGIVTHVDEDGVIHMNGEALMAFHRLYTAMYGDLRSSQPTLLDYQEFEGITLQNGDSLKLQFEFEVKKQNAD